MKVLSTYWPSEEFPPDTVANLRVQVEQRGRALFLPVLRCPYLTGWWAKMELFAPWNSHLRPCLYFDLDTQLVGDIGPLLELPEDRFLMLAGFVNTRARNSGVMVLPRHTHRIWEEFHSKCVDGGKFPRGDADFLAPYAEGAIQDYVDGIYSFKYHCHRASPPREGARVICYHGNPRPWNTPEGTWMREHWDAHIRPVVRPVPYTPAISSGRAKVREKARMAATPDE